MNKTVEDIEQDILTEFRSMLEVLKISWEKLGLSEEHQRERAVAVKDSVLRCIKEIHYSEVNVYEDYIERINKYTEELKTLNKELGDDVVVVDECLTLVDKEERLRQLLDDSILERHTRVKKMKELKTAEKRLCSILNLTPIEIRLETGVPSKSDLQALEEHVIVLKQEQERRYQRYCSARQELILIIDNTDLPLETDFERDVKYGEENPFMLPIALTVQNLETLDETVAKFRAKESELKLQKHHLLETAVKLWDRLNFSVNDRKMFLTNYADCRIATLERIKQEVDRCTEIKKKNIRSYINIVNSELHELWRKCHTSETHQKRFLAQFDVNDFSEEILNLFDVEIEEMSKYYEETEHILRKIEKRHELQDLLLVLANKAKDPERFKNRGGNLLKEEKERKKIQKDLPKLESEILRDIGQYEKESGKSFLFDGIDFQEYVKKQSEQTQTEKESKALSQKGQLMSIPVKSPMPSTPVVKRHVKVPQSAPSKLLKSNSKI